MEKTDIVLCVDASTMQRSSSGLITGVVFLRTSESDFPGKSWNDFVVVILGWWLDSLLTCFENGRAEFLFMDGPHSFEISIHGGEGRITLCPGRKPGPVHLFDHKQFGVALEGAARSVVDICSDRGWKNDDIDHLVDALERFSESGFPPR